MIRLNFFIKYSVKVFLTVLELRVMIFFKAQLLSLLSLEFDYSDSLRALNLDYTVD